VSVNQDASAGLFALFHIRQAFCIDRCSGRGAARLSSDERYDVKSILDSSFRYTNSVETDLRKTFARIRRQQRTDQQAQVKAEVESHSKVRLLRQKTV